MSTTAAGLTRDALWDGALTLWQPRRGQGYRFNLDPVLLSGFVPRADSVLELGAGCGVLSLLLLSAARCRRVTAVERQPQLAEACRCNARDNDLEQRMEVVCADLREVTLPRRFDVVAFNPPYFPIDHGHASPDPGRDAGRRECHGTLQDFVVCAARHVTDDGSVCAIVRWERGSELVGLARAAGLVRVCSRPVVPRHGVAPRHVLVRAQRGPAGASAATRESALEAPLIVHVGQGRTFSPEVQALLARPAG